MLLIIKPYLVEEFARQDNEKVLNGQNSSNKIVYDCMDPSPYYEISQEPFLDENDLIEILLDDQTNEIRKYPYGSNTITSSSNINARGMKINRYY